MYHPFGQFPITFSGVIVRRLYFCCSAYLISVSISLLSRLFCIFCVCMASSTPIRLDVLTSGMANSSSIVDPRDTLLYLEVQYKERYGHRLYSRYFAARRLLLFPWPLTMKIILTINRLVVYRLSGHMSSFRFWKQRGVGRRTLIFSFLASSLIWFSLKNAESIASSCDNVSSSYCEEFCPYRHYLFFAKCTPIETNSKSPGLVSRECCRCSTIVC